ncbi:MAG: Uncharacterized protein LiPW30_469 [Parcubacteria group bacterium LiPW_30]|nr:MAG: Uncharacterized protein LiPW30_469 [Parcubacteria group bacterium LiPW_30]
MNPILKQILVLVAVIIILLLGMKFLPPPSNSNLKNGDVPRIQPASSYLDAIYIIEGKEVTLANGVSEIEVVPGSVSKIVTRFFGSEVKHDFNDDGREDIAFLLTQETGGSGVFFYVVAALNTPDGYIGSHAVLLGDRIAPQTMHMEEGNTVMGTSRQNVIVVNYVVRLPGEPMTVRPSLGKSIWLKLDPKTMQFGEVAQNFEGEANTPQMTLGMKKWSWSSTSYNDGKKILPNKENTFILVLKDDGNFSATTDCNTINGRYSTKGNKITFSEMFSTLMYCEGSQEALFSKMLTETESYHFTAKGELVFGLKLDSGSFIFR